MPRNGSGTYALPSGNPVVTGTLISSTVHNNTQSDLGDELTNSLDKDGQTVWTGTQDANGNKIVLDTDGDTSIHASTDDQIDIEIGGADAVVMTADLTTLKNVLNFTGVETEVASGAFARTATFTFVDTEGSAGTDDLDTISGGVQGDILILTSQTASRVTTVKDAATLGSGNINLAGGADFALNHPHDKLMLIFRAVQWDEVSRSDNS